MKNTRGKYCIGLSGEQHFGHVIESARTSTGYYRHADGLGYAARDDEVKAGLSAVGVYGVENNFACPEGYGALRPINRLKAGRLSPAFRENLPAVWSNLLAINRHDNALAPKLFRALSDEVGRRKCGGVDAHLVGSGAKHRLHVVQHANPAAHGQRHEALVCRTFDNFHHAGSPMRAGRDIKKNHLISTLLVISYGQLHWVAHISQAAGLRAPELNAPSYLPIMDVKAGDNAFSKHLAGTFYNLTR